MNYLNRKKVFLWLAVAGAVIFVALIFLVSYLSNNSTTINPSPSPTITNPPTEPGVPGDPNSGSTTQYDNDYSEDIPYVPLPEGFDPKVEPTEGTVFDDAFVVETYDTLTCQLSKKNTVTERALEPLTNFGNDLRLAPSTQASATLQSVNSTLNKVKPFLGERLPANVADDIGISCYSELDLHDNSEG